MNNETGHSDHGHQTVEHLLEDIEEVLEELVDLEDCACRGQKPPKAKNYRIRIDGEKYTVSVRSMTGRELLQLAGKDPQKFMIVEKDRGEKPRRIALDERVDFTKPGIEKFLTQPLGQTEG
jgi:hypothetical protein